MKELDEKISDKIQKALENPLANMRSKQIDSFILFKTQNLSNT